MSLPGFKSSIELESGPTGVRLIDRQSGQHWPISDTESRLLALWDGTASATSLSARLFVEGLDVEPWQVEQFFARLSHASVLTADLPRVPDFIPVAAGIEALTDRVPTLRGDLLIARSRGQSTLEVKDPLSERSFTLYDFEVSIARMLDGKRTVAEVLAAATRLGIPVTLETLKTFLQQLRAYQFIQAAPAPSAPPTTWPKRREWSTGVRELYQSALRLLREGNYQEARGYADAMLQQDPSNEDATALLHRIIAEAAGPLEFLIPFDTMHSPLTSPAIAPNPFLSLDTQSPTMDTASLSLPLPEGERVGVRADAPLKRKSRLPLFLAVALVLAALEYLLHPVDVSLEFPADVLVDDLAVPRALRAGTAEHPEVASGTMVKKGALLARLTPEGAESPEALEARIQDLTTKRAAAKPATPKQLALARAAVKKATGAIAALNKQKKRATKKQLEAIEKKLQPKQQALDAAQATLEHPNLPAELERELDELTAKKAAAVVQQERSPITAPAEGLFLAPPNAPEKLLEHDPYGHLVSPTFRVVTKEPHDAKEALFISPVGRVEVKDGKFEGELKWVGAKGVLQVSAGHKPWVLTLLD